MMRVCVSDPMLSIVVPIYNVAPYLDKCICSIVSQTYRNLEIILVDDGSTDGSSEICDCYARKDGRIHVVHKDNGGLVSARKAGTAVATGNYILNVDGDDWIEKDRAEVLIRDGIRRSGADMICLAGHRRDFGEDSILMENDIPIKTFYEDEIIKQVFPLICDVKEVFGRKILCSMWSWAIRRELLQEKQRLVDERITMGEDEICIWFCLLSAKSVTLIKQAGYHYVQRKSSLGYMASSLDETNSLEMNIWFRQLKKFLRDRDMFFGEVERMFVCTVIRLIIMASYETILKSHQEYLYPFPIVKRNCKIIVYGAGKMGHSLMRHLVRSKGYQVTLWTDQNVKRSVLSEYKVSLIEEIEKVKYDYIVIAVIDAGMAREIKHSLMLRGVPEEKIATMDASVITEDAIPGEITRD